jgi:tetratricopeptide (TPR) repeat protein
MKRSMALNMTTLVVAVSLIASAAMAQVGSTGKGNLAGTQTLPGFDKNFNPTNTNTPYGRGLAAYDAGDYVLAERMFDEVLSESPNDATVLTLSGMAMSGRGDYKGARRQFDHAIRVDRQNLDAHREQGVALAKLGDAKGAQEMLDWLKARQTACGGKCEDPGKIDRAVDTVQKAMVSAPPKKG